MHLRYSKIERNERIKKSTDLIEENILEDDKWTYVNKKTRNETGIRKLLSWKDEPKLNRQFNRDCSLYEKERAELRRNWRIKSSYDFKENRRLRLLNSGENTAPDGNEVKTTMLSSPTLENTEPDRNEVKSTVVSKQSQENTKKTPISISLDNSLTPSRIRHNIMKALSKVLPRINAKGAICITPFSK